jgi:hypothetical protein
MGCALGIGSTEGDSIDLRQASYAVAFVPFSEAFEKCVMRPVYKCNTCLQARAPCTGTPGQPWAPMCNSVFPVRTNNHNQLLCKAAAATQHSDGALNAIEKESDGTQDRSSKASRITLTTKDEDTIAAIVTGMGAGLSRFQDYE